MTRQDCVHPLQACHLTGVLLCAGLGLTTTQAGGDTGEVAIPASVPALTQPGALVPCALEFPHTTITSGQLSALVYLPDAQRGYYRGTRFDWSGIVAQVSHKGHTFLGPLHPVPKPGTHDGVAGLAEEFGMLDPLGFDEVPQGGSFVKIGVGELHRPSEAPYQFGWKYRIVKPGTWSVRVGASMMHFEQDFTGPRGWGYHYSKTITLAEDAPTLTITRTLRNTGEKPIRTTHYNHNFITFDGRKTIGPEYRMEFAWPMTVKELRPADVLSFQGSVLNLSRSLQKDETIWTVMEGFQGTEHHGVVVFDPVSKMAMEMRGDQPVVRAVVWGTNPVICPELFIAIEVEPGQSMTWSNTYRFAAPLNE